jgi:hypothetical protein
MAIMFVLAVLFLAEIGIIVVLARNANSATLRADEYKRQRDVARKYLGNIAAYSNNSDPYSYQQAQLGLIESVQEHPDTLE